MTCIPACLLVYEVLQDHAVAVDLLLRVAFELLDAVLGLRVPVLVLHLLY